MMHQRNERKKPLFRKVNTRTHGVNHLHGEDYKQSRNKETAIGMRQGFGQHIRTAHITPVMNMVRVLSKDELAAMAEALVNLTVFKRKVTNTLETVGGPVDVAVISKGDGLVWVKRKHYFPPELNASFYKNYFRGIDND